MSILPFRPALLASLPTETLRRAMAQVVALRLHQALRIEVVVMAVIIALVTTIIYVYQAMQRVDTSSKVDQGSPEATRSELPIVPSGPRAAGTNQANPLSSEKFSCVLQQFLIALQNQTGTAPANPLAIASRGNSASMTVHLNLQDALAYIQEHGFQAWISQVRAGANHRGLDPSHLYIAPETLEAFERLMQMQVSQAPHELQTNRHRLALPAAANLPTTASPDISHLLEAPLYHMLPAGEEAQPDESAEALTPEQRVRLEIAEAMEEFPIPEGAHLVRDKHEGFCMVELDAQKDYQDPDNHLARLQPPHDSGALAQAGVLGSKMLGLSCYFTTTLGPIFDKEAFKAAAMKKDYTGNLWRALNSINERKCLTPRAIDTYSQWLMKKYPTLKIAEGSTHEFSSITIPQIETGKTLYAIPVVLKGVRSHIVTFIYDAKSHTLEYYDSKGWNIRDCQNYLIDKKFGEPITLLDMYLKIMKAYSTAEKGAPNVWENQKAHQSDFYNCGIYVLDRIRKHAVSARSEEGIQHTHKRDLTGPSFGHANHSIRLNILKSLLPELERFEANVPTEEQGVPGAAASSLADFVTPASTIEGLLDKMEEEDI